jgi:hypothetical protein
MTPQEIDALPEYTTAQRLKLVRYILTQLSGRTDASYSIAGRTYTNRDIPSLAAEEQRLEQKLADEENAACDTPLGRIAHARFEDPR